MQGVGALAVVSIGVLVGICASLGICVVVPCKLLTGRLALGVVCAVEDGEVQSVGALAVISVGVLVGVCAGLGVGVVVPRELLTGGLALGVVCAVEDGEVQ